MNAGGGKGVQAERARMLLQEPERLGPACETPIDTQPEPPIIRWLASVYRRHSATGNPERAGLTKSHENSLPANEDHSALTGGNKTL